MIPVHAPCCTCPSCEYWERLEAFGKSQISLRDFFAGCALPAIIADRIGQPAEIIAKEVNSVADAMMKTREQSAS